MILVVNFMKRGKGSGSFARNKEISIKIVGY
jgi:hypothetical protein